MEYPKSDEEFYELMKKKKEEINLMNIPQSKKEDLYSLVDETIERHEDWKKIDLGKSFNDLFDAMGRLYKTNIEFVQSAEELRKKTKSLGNIVKKLAGENFLKQNPGIQN